MRSEKIVATSKRRLGRVLKCFAAAIVLLLIVGISYEQLGQRKDRTRFAQIGQSIDMGGRKMNILCSGEGSPTVIFEGAISLEWTPIHSEVAKYTRACMYDRAGYGWSDPGPDPRTSAAMASDLHALLARAGVPAPYVLVGASFGGFPVRVFAGKYPTEVAGAVLVDASHEDQHEPASMLSPMNRLPSAIRTVMYAALPIMRNIGLLRFFSGSSQRRPPRPGITREQEECFQFLDCRPNAIVTDAKEAWNWEKSASEARLTGNLGDRPLIVLTAGRAFVPRNPIEAREAADFHQN